MFGKAKKVRAKGRWDQGLLRGPNAPRSLMVIKCLICVADVVSCPLDAPATRASLWG